MDDLELYNKLLLWPESYKTILGNFYGRNTTTVIMRKKILRGIRNGILGRLYVLGTRGGERIIFNMNKSYSIIIISPNRGEFNYYVCQKIEKIDDNNIKLIECKELLDNKWSEIIPEININPNMVIKRI